MDNLLSSVYGKAHLDAVPAMSDQIAVGAVSSLRGVGYGKGETAMPVVTGQDAEIPSVKAIMRSDQYSTVFKDTRALAEAAAFMMDNTLQGKPVAVNDTQSYDNGAMIVPNFHSLWWWHASSSLNGALAGASPKPAHRPSLFRCSCSRMEFWAR